MNRHSRRAFVALAAASGTATLLGSPAQAAPHRDTTPDAGPESGRERGNKALVRRAFARQNGGGSFFDVLHPDVVWSIVNGRTYHGKQAFLDEGSAPVTTRLATHLVMTPHHLWADGDTVITRFAGDATALDGLPYHNEYCWVLAFRRNQVVRAHAYLDTTALTDLIDRVPPARSRLRKEQ
ncbi:nuclear transport factor 2 family protein [Streptomyces sp. NPDC017979]|uniref:nuclear transport factor 2 family protein n=1 Tax=Streptomyces sp. NPDC017979 TaxID=3365024 RepID=UPI0037B7F343